MTQLEFELDFSTSEKQLAKYILEHGEKVLQYSIQDLAKKTYTSPATIVRLCKKIGLHGYSDFKIKYSAELQFDFRFFIITLLSIQISAASGIANLLDDHNKVDMQ